MAQLAIKGHPTRGKEVIEILEMLGGKNYFHMNGFTEEFIYYICEEKDNQIHSAIYPTNQIVFTIEKYLKKFPYKVGDKVSSKYLKNYKIEKMEWEDTNNRVIYKLQGMGWYNAPELQPYEEETMEENLTIQDIRDNNAEWLLNKLEGMSAKNVLQTITGLYDRLHKPQYPKTFVECCEILYPNENFQLIAPPFKGHNYKQLFALQQLLICRDAYWKIAGEQMKLGKPWKPDWESENTTKYTISQAKNKIRFLKAHEYNHILSFPTTEMREAFYENFKKLIEICEDFL